MKCGIKGFGVPLTKIGTGEHWEHFNCNTCGNKKPFEAGKVYKLECGWIICEKCNFEMAEVKHELEQEDTYKEGL